MPPASVNDNVSGSYILHALLRDLVLPAHELELPELAARLQSDLTVLNAIHSTQYLNSRERVPRSEDPTLHLAWQYAEDPAYHARFQHMLCVSYTFQVILELSRITRLPQCLEPCPGSLCTATCCHTISDGNLPGG